MLKKVARELENQKKAQAELEKVIDARNSDDSEQLIWSATSYNARGQIEGELAGNGYLTTRYHEVDGTIKQIKVGVAKKLIANYTYGYDNRNNLLSRTDNIEHISEKFTYDNLDRLSSWRLSSKKRNITRSYRYDIYGNMVYKSNVGEFGFNAKNQIVTAPSKLGFFNYDKNGNMLNGNNKTYVYNKANQVVRVEYNKHRAYEEYLYDESENIIRTNNSKGELSYKLGDYEVTYKREHNKDNVYMYHRIYANGNQVALHIKHLINDRKQVDRTLYFHKDNLGSTLLTTDNMARVVNRDLYAPYGEKINLKKATSIYKGILDNRLPGFTGHNTIEGANVIVMKSRVYDPVIARFTSPDTIVPDVNSALGFNRYAYVYNNPLKYVDPDGHNPLFFFFLGAVSYTIGATSDNAWVRSIGMVLGSKLMGMGLSGAFGENQALLEGAVRTFSQSVLSGQDIDQIFTNTALFALNAQITGGLPKLLNNGDHGFGFGLMMGHSLVQGTFTALRGGKFKTGFISGMASKAISGIMDSMGYDIEPTFGKSMINIVLSGMASKASGGDFVQGAMSAMVVWLYNDNDPRLNGRGVGVAAGGDGKGTKEDARIARATIVKTKASIIKGSKDLYDGVLSIPKTAYSYGDYLARYTGFRDWQEGSTIPWNKLEAYAEYEAFKYAIKYHSADIASGLWNDMQKRPNYYIGGAVVGPMLSGLGVSGRVTIATSSAVFTIHTAGSITDYIDSHLNSYIQGQ